MFNVQEHLAHDGGAYDWLERKSEVLTISLTRMLSNFTIQSKMLLVSANLIKKLSMYVCSFLWSSRLGLNE
jgi:hypothetical protein